MKAILYIVAIVVACGAIFFSNALSGKFSDLQKDRLTTIEDTATTVKDVETHDKTLEKGVDTLKKDNLECKDEKDKVRALAENISSLQEKSREWDTKLEAQKKELATATEAAETVQKILGTMGTGVTLDNLGDKIAEVEASKKSKTDSLEEKTKNIDDTEKLLASNRAESDRLTKRLVERSVRINNNAKEALVTAVDQDWGFLVIGAGSNSGFSPQTGLLVTRDGHLIGRVRPSSIEPNQTIAEIDFKSIAAGARIMPGDRVMLGKPNAN